MRVSPWWSLVVALVLTPLSASAQELGEREVVERLLAESPSLRASLADARAARARVTSAEGERLPVFTATATGSHTEQITNTAAGVAATATERIGFTTGLAYTTSWGLGVELGVTGGVGWREVNRDPSTTMLFRIGPNYDTSVTLGLTQPLFRGAGEDGVLGAVREAEAGRRSADATLEAELSQLCAEALGAHVELWYAQRALDVQTYAVALGERQVAEAELRVTELGTVARTEVLRLASELAGLRRTAAQAETTLVTQALALGRVLGFAPESAEGLRAEPEPPALEPPAALADLMETARARSPELASLEAEVQRAEAALARARDAAEPRVDLTGDLAAGVMFTDATLAMFQLPNDRPALSATVGLEVELPISDDAARGAREEAEANLEGAEARRSVREREIEADVASRRAELVRALRDVTLAEEAAEAAAALAEAERQSFALGLSESFAVVEAQQAEREARLSYLRAVADYAAARIELLDRTGTLLSALAVEIPEVAR